AEGSPAGAAEPRGGAMALAPNGGGQVQQQEGQGHVTTGGGQAFDLSPNERVTVDPRGRASEKQALLPPPVLLSPPHQANLAYAQAEAATTVLVWRVVPGAASYHVMLDDDGWFVEPLVDRTGVTTTSLELPGLRPGTYYWRVASCDAHDREGAFAALSRFLLAAVSGPPLVVESVELRRNVAHVRGRTVAGAALTIQAQRVE